MSGFSRVLSSVFFTTVLSIICIVSSLMYPGVLKWTVHGARAKRRFVTCGSAMLSNGEVVELSERPCEPTSAPILEKF